jgi:rhamnulokinase
MPRFLAFDLGAESGRAILGTLTKATLRLDELHRFLNEPVQLPTGLYWDVLRLFHEVRRGLTIAGRERKLPLDGIGVDTWGVDFGLLGSDGALVANPRHYRDPHTNGALERVFAVVPKNRIYEETGLQFLQFNTLFQWHALREAESPALREARRLLFLPDLISYFLTGVQKCEQTIASTSQFYNPRTQRFACGLLERLGLDAGLLPEIIPPGTRLGPLLPDVGDATGLPSVPVYATASHDTASAVAAEGDEWCYISSGTWSLMGVELEQPIINAQALRANFTNEVGAAGRIRFLKNIAGLWLVQECRKAWALEGNAYTYDDLTEMAEKAAPDIARLDPDAFMEPGDMPKKIAAYCRYTRQPVPKQPGAMVRVILESLAERYAQVLVNLESLTGKHIRVIHIVGGGSRNKLLNRLVAEKTGRTVVAGPTEATAIGNIMVQAIGAGNVKGLEEARAVVRRSFPVEKIS